MDNKNYMPQKICEDDVIAYIAGRYNTTPLEVMTNFLQHEGGCPGRVWSHSLSKRMRLH